MNDSMGSRDWFHEAYEKRRAIGAGAALLLLLIGATAWWVNRTEHRSQDNMSQAESIVFELTKSHKLFENPNGDKTTKELVEKLQTLAKSDAAIRERMNGILAEIDLLQGNSNAAAPAQAVRLLTQAPLPNFAQFSEIGLLSQKGRPREAIELADKLLKAEEIAATPQLLAFTLLQKAALCKSLGKTEEAKKTIEELKSVIKKRPDILNHIQEEGITLLDFLEKQHS